MRYSERLWPSGGTWVVPPLAAVGAAFVLAPFGWPAVVVAVVLTLTLVGAGLVLASPRLEVCDGMLRAGRARVELHLLGEAEGFAGADARRQRGPALDARAYLVLRGWVDPVVRVELCDPQDPTPYWLLSTRHPEQLVDALRVARV